MKHKISKLKTLLCGLMGAVVVAASVVIPTVPAHAESLSAGKYSVTVTSTYQNPDTGTIDDVGQNPAIGQTMVQAQVQTVGYVEIMEDGTIYLNTRWNQADSNIYAGFKTSSDNSKTWVDRQFEVTNQMDAGSYEFGGNTFEATVTDYRIQLGSINDTIRCTNYVEAMARECTWFCYISAISDFDESSWTNVQAPSISTDTMNQVADTYAAQKSTNGGSSSQSGSSQSATSGQTSGSTSAANTADAAASGTSVDGLKDRTVAEAKTADELLDGASGVLDADDADTEAASAKAADKSGDTETVAADTGKIVVAAIIGVVAGAAVVALIAYFMAKKRKNYQDLFADVDDTDGQKLEDEKQTGRKRPGKKADEKDSKHEK